MKPSASERSFAHSRIVPEPNVQPLDPPIPPEDCPECRARSPLDSEHDPFSKVGRKLACQSAIGELMDDLGSAMTTQPDVLMLGGGNPAAIPEIRQTWRGLMRGLMAREDQFDRMLANYEPPRGNPQFIQAFSNLLLKRYSWPVTPDNIAVTNGTQVAAFVLFNLLAGRGQGGAKRKILMPMAPEYIGYADQGLEADLFVVCRPAISWPDGESKRRFKYHIDFAAVEQCLESGDIAAITVSRPTNPTGNVLTEEELIRLSDLAARYAIFLVVDNAYGVPFPKVVFTEAKPYWAPHVINLFSLSKLGLPGVRTGIVVGPSEIAAAIQSWTAIVGLANNNVGQQLVLPLIENGELLELGPRILQPFYRERSWAAQESIEEYLGAAKVDWALHVSEGAFFLWLWLRGLRYTSRELYRRLKSRNVLIVPGEYFFYGLSDPWPHQHECVRISFSQSPEIVREGIRRLAEVAASRG